MGRGRTSHRLRPVGRRACDLCRRGQGFGDQVWVRDGEEETWCLSVTWRRSVVRPHSHAGNHTGRSSACAPPWPVYCVLWVPRAGRCVVCSRACRREQCSADQPGAGGAETRDEQPHPERDERRQTVAGRSRQTRLVQDSIGLHLTRHRRRLVSHHGWIEIPFDWLASLRVNVVIVCGQWCVLGYS